MCKENSQDDGQQQMMYIIKQAGVIYEYESFGDGRICERDLCADNRCQAQK